jgi:quercetin dioxygenase-like cupin family protein
MPTGTAATIKGLVDSSPDHSLLVDAAAYYAQRALPPKGLDSETLFDSPRGQAMIRTAVRGTTLAPHFHASSDEIMVILAGRGELLIDGQWLPTQAGHLHVCPRGIIHGTRALEEDLRFLSIFTPKLPAGGDINWSAQ